jgi:flagellar assembly protein FliH
MKMPSSPEPEAAAAAAAPSAQSAQLAQPWDPAELGSTLLPAPRLSLHESGPDERNQPTPVVLFEIAAGPSIHADALSGARAAAEAAGYAAGWAAGAIAARQASEVELSAIRAAAAAEMDARTAQVNAILGRVRDAASAFERRAVPATEDIENLVVSTAFSVAESIVGASLRDDETRGITALARALALSPVGAPAIISLNPQDHALLGAKATELAMGHDVQIVSDPSLKPGDATVSSGATTIDARISAGLARVQEVLAR